MANNVDPSEAAPEDQAGPSEPVWSGYALIWIAQSVRKHSIITVI